MVHLVERNAKKAAFLREAVASHWRAGARCIARDIEDFAEEIRRPADVVTARALAPLRCCSA